MEMTSEEFQTIGLYDHNADSYRMVRNAYESGKNIAGKYMLQELVNLITHFNLRMTIKTRK